MLQGLINSRVYQAAFSKGRLHKFLDSLHFPVMDGITPSKKESFTMAGRTAFLGSPKDMDDIVEAFRKVAKNIERLTV